jgi:sulfur carrier protein ThiS
MSVRLYVKLRGWLHDFLPDGQQAVDVPEGTTALDVMDELRIPVGPCLWSVNGQAAGYDTTLHEGDELDVALIASGG